MPKDKLEVIKTQFQKAEELLQKEGAFKKLKDNSALKKLCIAIQKYRLQDYYGACINIYDLFHVRTWKTKDRTCIEFIKQKLKSFKKEPSAPVVQMELFATA